MVLCCNHVRTVALHVPLVCAQGSCPVVQVLTSKRRMSTSLRYRSAAIHLRTSNTTGSTAYAQRNGIHGAAHTPKARPPNRSCCMRCCPGLCHSHKHFECPAHLLSATT